VEGSFNEDLTWKWGKRKKLIPQTFPRKKKQAFFKRRNEG